MEISAHLTPKASVDKVEALWRDEAGFFHLKARVRAVPEKGKGNEALIKLLSAHFRVPKTRITFIRGETSRRKVVDIPLELSDLLLFLTD